MKRSSRFLAIMVFLLVSGCIRVVPGHAGYGEKIRILILKGAKEADVRGSLQGGNILIKRVAGGLTINGNPGRLPLRLSPIDSLIYLNGRPYRGTLDVYEDKDGIMVVDELPIETYLVGIINNEISSKWPQDVIKAQAVISRTYAMYQKRKKSPRDLYHLEGSVLGQVYNGVRTEDPQALRAVRETTGEILTYGGEPALTVFHSNAGGMTDSARDIWSHDYPYLKAIKSPYDSSAPRFSWDFAIPADSLKELLQGYGYRVSEPVEIRVDELTYAGRVKRAVIKDIDDNAISLSGEDLRRIIGYSNLRSTMFEVSGPGSLFVFKGRGSGHGVGLSQWGAKGMAEDGYSYRKILQYFYPGTGLERAY